MGINLDFQLNISYFHTYYHVNIYIIVENNMYYWLLKTMRRGVVNKKYNDI